MLLIPSCREDFIRDYRSVADFSCITVCLAAACSITLSSHHLRMGGMISSKVCSLQSCFQNLGSDWLVILFYHFAAVCRDKEHTQLQGEWSR